MGPASPKPPPIRINDDVVFEIELIKQVEINVDYILMLVQQCRVAEGDGENKEIRATIDRAVDSSPTLRNKKDLIEDFVESISAHQDVADAWTTYIAARREAELEQIIGDEALRAEPARAFVANAFHDGRLETSGTAITRILPPVSRFGGGAGGHEAKKRTVIEKLSAYFERFFGLG